MGLSWAGPFLWSINMRIKTIMLIWSVCIPWWDGLSHSDVVECTVVDIYGMIYQIHSTADSELWLCSKGKSTCQLQLKRGFNDSAQDLHYSLASGRAPIRYCVLAWICHALQLGYHMIEMPTCTAAQHFVGQAARLRSIGAVFAWELWCNKCQSPASCHREQHQTGSHQVIEYSGNDPEQFLERSQFWSKSKSEYVRFTV